MSPDALPIDAPVPEASLLDSPLEAVPLGESLPEETPLDAFSSDEAPLGRLPLEAMPLDTPLPLPLGVPLSEAPEVPPMGGAEELPPQPTGTQSHPTVSHDQSATRTGSRRSRTLALSLVRARGGDFFMLDCSRYRGEVGGSDEGGCIVSGMTHEERSNSMNSRAFSCGDRSPDAHPAGVGGSSLVSGLPAT
jgi:hypothetical protein